MSIPTCLAMRPSPACSYSAVALNMFTSALVMLEFVLIGGAVQQLWTEEGIKFAKIELDMPLLIGKHRHVATCPG